MNRPILTVLTVVALFGVVIPFYKRYDFLDPVMLTAYFCLPVVLVAPIAAASFAGGAPGTMDTIRRSLVVAFYGWGMGMVIIAAGLITVNAVVWHGHVLLPGAMLLVVGALFSATAALASVVVTGILAHRFSARTARTSLRFAFLALLIALVLIMRGASAEWTAAFWSHATTPEMTRFGFYGACLLAMADAGALFLFARLRRT